MSEQQQRYPTNWQIAEGFSPNDHMMNLKGKEYLKSHTEVDNDCWRWTGAIGKHGYGNLLWQGMWKRAHRFAYEMYVGPIPAGLVLDHHCGHTWCVNPAHLQPMTQRQNVLRSNSPTALNSQAAHCHKGHEFTPDNTTVLRDKSGVHRRCKACHRNRQAQYLARKAV